MYSLQGLIFAQKQNGRWCETNLPQPSSNPLREINCYALSFDFVFCDDGSRVFHGGGLVRSAASGVAGKYPWRF
jgi:hypothetical protein